MTDPKRDPVIYKLLSLSDWALFRRQGRFYGSAHDRADGFVHMSTRDQLPGTLERHYADAGEIVLVELGRSALDGPNLRWEPARNGSLFPHLYAPLPLSAVMRHWPLRPAPGGGYARPDFDHSA